MSVQQVFEEQAAACKSLGSPFMARLLSLIGSRIDRSTPIGRRILDWQGDLGPASQSVPLRLAGALHALVLQGHEALASSYQPHLVSDHQLWDAINGAFLDHADEINTILDSPPQTNEVRRSAVLLAAASEVSGMFGLPFSIYELGSSAGLNLMFDQFGLAAGDQVIGAKDPKILFTPDLPSATPVNNPVHITNRSGCDIAPINLTDPNAKLRLLSYIWPDQADRMAMTKVAIQNQNAKVLNMGAFEYLKTNLALKNGEVQFVFHTIAWQYFPSEEQERCKLLLEEIGSDATADCPLAWFSMENNGEGRGAELRLRAWPGNINRVLGTADFHGRWIDWT